MVFPSITSKICIFLIKEMNKLTSECYFTYLIIFKRCLKVVWIIIKWVLALIKGM